jgi:ABC-type antimicrobial peptide transport system permease subunit
MPDLRAIISELDPTAAIHRTQTMEERLRELTAPRRFILQLVTTFSALAIVLAVIGLAGVVAESVSQRVREIGIRMALGARSGSIITLVVRQGIRVIAIGATVGIALAYQLRTTLEGFVYGVTTTDVWSYGAATAAVVLSGIVACYLPARRATTIDPVIALRSE